MRYRRRAAIIAISYLFLGAGYIFLSARIAEMMSHSIGQYVQIEEIKGTIFMIVTAIGLYLFSRHQLQEIAKDASGLLENRDVLHSSERRALAALFARSFAHDCRKVIDPTREALGRIKVCKDCHCERLSTLGQSLESLERLSSQLQDTSKLFSTVDKREVNLGPLLKSSVEVAHNYSPLQGCRVRIADCPDVQVSAYPALIHQMVVNLMMNAAEAMSGSGKIEVALRSEPTGVVIEVHDNGPGIPAEQWRQVFAPFYTTKPHGPGLGLLSVQACALAHGGEVEISASHLGGARVEVKLPPEIRL